MKLSTSATAVVIAAEVPVILILLDTVTVPAVSPPIVVKSVAVIFVLSTSLKITLPV